MEISDEKWLKVQKKVFYSDGIRNLWTTGPDELISGVIIQKGMSIYCVITLSKL
jgi:hypothetical protein